MSVHRWLWCLGMVFLICAKCGSRAESASVRAGGSTDGRPGNDRRGRLFHLEIPKPSIKKAIDSTNLQGSSPKFVRVEVVEVRNPKMHSLAFELRYQPR